MDGDPASAVIRPAQILSLVEITELSERPRVPVRFLPLAAIISQLLSGAAQSHH